MYQFFVILILIVCVLLSIVVLIQNSKGGGLVANISAPQQVMGVRKTTDVLEKATWWLAIALIVFSLAATASINHQGPEQSLNTEVSTSNVNVAPVAAPAAEAPVADAE